MSGKRLYELDGLRGIAALVVLFFHYLYAYNLYFGHSFEIPKIIGYGKFGVQLFFMISGFVIFWSILKSNRPLDFVWSRFSRLFPVYWICVITTFIIVSIFGIRGNENWAVGISDLFVNLTMIQEYLGFPNVDWSYWTLSLELAFYFWLLVLSVFGLLKYLDIILIIWVTIGVFFEFFGVKMNGSMETLWLIKYIQYFAMGIAFFKLNSGQSGLSTYLLVACCILSVLLQWPLTNFIFQMGIVVVFLLAIKGKLPILSHKIFRYFGDISYPLYLLHAFIGYIMMNSFYSKGLPPWLGISAAFCVSVALATLFTYTVDKRSIRWLREYYNHNATLQRMADKFTPLHARREGV